MLYKIIIIIKLAEIYIKWATYLYNIIIYFLVLWYTYTYNINETCALYKNNIGLGHYKAVVNVAYLWCGWAWWPDRPCGGMINEYRKGIRIFCAQPKRNIVMLLIRVYNMLHIKNKKPAPRFYPSTASWYIGIHISI